MYTRLVTPYVRRPEKHSFSEKEKRSLTKKVEQEVEGLQQNLADAIDLIEEQIKEGSLDKSLEESFRTLRTQLRFYQLILQKDAGSRNRIKDIQSKILVELNKLKSSLEVNDNQQQTEITYAEDGYNRNKSNAQVELSRGGLQDLRWKALRTVMLLLTVFAFYADNYQAGAQPIVGPEASVSEEIVDVDYSVALPDANAQSEEKQAETSKRADTQPSINNVPIQEFVAEVPEVVSIERQKLLEISALLEQTDFLNSKQINLAERVSTWMVVKPGEENITTLYPEKLEERFLEVVQHTYKETGIDIAKNMADMYRPAKFWESMHRVGAVDISLELKQVAIRQLRVGVDGRLYWVVLLPDSHGGRFNLTEAFRNQGFRPISVQGLSKNIDLSKANGLENEAADDFLAKYGIVGKSQEWWHFEPGDAFDLVEKIFGITGDYESMTLDQYDVGRWLSMIAMFGENFPGFEKVENQQEVELARQIYKLLKQVESGNITPEEMFSNISAIISTSMDGGLLFRRSD